MTRMISHDERLARLARRHLLVPAQRTDDVAGIADALVGLHSSDPVTVFLSVFARMVEPSVQAVEEALYVDRALVRHHAMRRTLWVARPHVVRLMHAAATRKLAAAEHRRTARLLGENGVADPEAWLADARDRTLEVLRAEGPLSARALGERVPALRHPLVMAPGKSYSATVSAHTRVLLGLGFEGRLVRTRPVGTWISGQYTWSVMDDWLPGGVDGLTEAEGAAGLADRWLRAFGPATAEDLQWWAGWTAAATRRALTDCAAVPVLLPEGPGWLAVGDEAEAPPVAPWVALLPGLDPTTMGWKHRSWYLPDAARDAFDRNGNAGPTIWVDGRVVGAWAQAPDGEIRTHLFVDVPARRRSEIADRCGWLRSLLGETRFTIRFPGAVEARLLG